MEQSPQDILEDILNEIKKMFGEIQQSKDELISQREHLNKQLRAERISQLYFNVEIAQIKRLESKLSDYSRELQKQRTAALHKLLTLN